MNERVGKDLYDLFKEIFNLKSQQKQPLDRWFELISQFLILTHHVDFKSYLPPEHTAENKELNTFQSRMHDYVEGSDINSKEQLLDTFNRMDSEAKKDLVEDIHQLLLPLDSLDLFKLFVYKRVKPKQAIKRPFEQVTHSSATEERDPKMVKQAVAATDSPSGATSSLRTSPLSIPNPKQLAQQARSLNVKDVRQDESVRADEEKIIHSNTTFSVGSSKNNASASPKPSRASKLLADSKNHNIFQDQDIDYEQIELNEAIASNQSIVRFEDVKKKLQECANVQLDPFEQFKFEKQKVALINYQVSIVNPTKSKKLQGYFNEYFERFPKLYYTLSIKDICDGMTEYLRRVLNPDNGCEDIGRKLKILPSGYPKKFSHLESKYKEYSLQQKEE